MNKEEKSWILYDVANSAFVLIIVTTIIPVFFKEFASLGVEDHISTARLGFGNSIASLIIAVFAPFLGVIADFEGYKKKLLAMFLSLGLLFTVMLILPPRGNWVLCLSIFILAKIGWLGANISYDSFLVDITVKERRDKISSHGYAWGYVGSVVPFLIVISIILLWPISGKADFSLPISAVRISFLTVALWWFFFSIPILKNVKQKYAVKKEPNLLKSGVLRLLKTIRKIKEYKKAFTFLLAYFFYIDGVNTIITMSAAYGMDIGLDLTTLIFVILMVQIVAFPSAIVFGKMAERYSTEKMILTGIAVYVFITIIAFFLPVIKVLTIKKYIFWVISFLVATSMGGIQALSRSYFSKLIPQKHSGEFFGFYNIFGKFALILGPLLMGVFTMIFGHSRFGILSIAVLLITGGWLLIVTKRIN